MKTKEILGRDSNQLFSFVRPVDHQLSLALALEDNKNDLLSQMISPLTQSTGSRGADPQRNRMEGRFQTLQDSIVGYFEAKQDNLPQFLQGQLAAIRFNYRNFKEEVIGMLNSFRKFFRKVFQTVSEQMEQLRKEKDHFKQKFDEIYCGFTALKKQNQILKQHLEEWQLAKQRRKIKNSIKDPSFPTHNHQIEDIRIQSQNNYSMKVKCWDEKLIVQAINNNGTEMKKRRDALQNISLMFQRNYGSKKKTSTLSDKQFTESASSSKLSHKSKKLSVVSSSKLI